MLNKLIKEKKAVQKSFSQCGEDLILYKLLFNILKLKTISYLDIGCFHPIEISNTYYFYKKRFNGVCVDANQDLSKDFKKLRPKDIFLNCGITDGYDEEKSFFKLNVSTLNTFDEMEAKRVCDEFGYKIQEIVKIKVRNINSIIEQYFIQTPELVSIDVEGLDLAVIKSLDLKKHKPACIVVETLKYQLDKRSKEDKATDIIRYLENNGYYLFADNYINSILVDEDLFFD